MPREPTIEEVEEANKRARAVEFAVAQFEHRPAKTPKDKTVAKKTIHWCQYGGCPEPPKSRVMGRWLCKKHARAERKRLLGNRA